MEEGQRVGGSFTTAEAEWLSTEGPGPAFNSRGIQACHGHSVPEMASDGRANVHGAIEGPSLCSEDRFGTLSGIPKFGFHWRSSVPGPLGYSNAGTAYRSHEKVLRPKRTLTHAFPVRHCIAMLAWQSATNGP